MAKTAPGKRPRRFRLSLVGPIEDQPRLVRAYGRACDGEFALVMRPGEARAVLVLVTKKEGAFVWRSGEDGDAPRRPDTPIEPAEAVALVKAEQKDVPKVGPITLRGRWTGYLHCDEGAPRVELHRKLASYGTLTIESHGERGWSWSFERVARWFSEAGTVGGEGLPTLAAAIEAGALGAMRLVREACAFRDTRRRAAHDPDYAARHPIKAPKPMKDPTERLRVRERGRKRPAAPPPKPINDGAPAPPVPTDAAALDRMAEVATREGDALARLQGARWLWEEPTPVRDIAAWFEEHALDAMAERLREYAAHPEQPLDDFLADLEGELKAARRRHDVDEAEEAEARRQFRLLRETLTITPALMERARRLIRYATSMARSPLCRGPERDEALEAVERAAHAYEEARAAVLEGRSWDALRTLRRIGERVALSAAKAARSCAAGQTSLAAWARRAAAPEAASPASPSMTVEELRAATADQAAAFHTDPTAGNAKKWVKAAMLRLDLHPLKLSARTRSFEDLGGGRHVFVTAVMPQAVQGDETNDKLRLVAQAAPKGLSLHDWRYEAGSGKPGRKKGAKAASPSPAAPEGWRPFEEGDRVVLDGQHGVVERVPAGHYGPDDRVTFLPDGSRVGRRVVAGRLVRESAGGGDAAEAPDAAKDKALIDAFSAAIKAALEGKAA